MTLDSYIDISDFSPGIYSDLFAGVATNAKFTGVTLGDVASTNQLSPHDHGISAPAVAAVLEGTYRCASDPSGALVPLPRAVDGETFTRPANGTAATSQNGIYTVDILSAPRWKDQDELYMMVWMNHDFNDGNSRQLYLQVLRWARNIYTGVYTAKSDVFWGRMLGTSTNPDDIGMGNMTLVRAKSSASPTDVREFFPILAMCCRNTTQGDWDNGTIPTNENAHTSINSASYVGAVETGAWVGHGGVVNFYPNPASPGSDSWTNLTNGNLKDDEVLEANYVLSHQSRIVTVCRGIKSMAGSAWWNVDPLAYTPAADPTGAYGSVKNLTIGDENPFRIGAAVSMNSDELFIVKVEGGALLLRGDLDYPIVTRLQMVQSTEGVFTRAIACPLGAIYGTRSGIYSWQGGHISQLLSPQLEGFFYNTRGENLDEYAEDYAGDFAWWHPWLVVPNNFIMDSRTGSWWRLDDPATYGSPWHSFTVSGNTKTLYAIPNQLNANDVLWTEFEPGVYATSYSWNSQPLVQSLEETHSYKEVTLVATPQPGTQHTCTVTITLTGYDDDGDIVQSTPVVFEFMNGSVATTTDSKPVVMRKDIESNFVAKYVQMKIEAESDQSMAAPKIHHVRVKYGQRGRSPKRV